MDTTFMDKTFNLFLNSTKYKRIFYSLYSTDPKNKNLDNIKKLYSARLGCAFFKILLKKF